MTSQQAKLLKDAKLTIRQNSATGMFLVKLNGVEKVGNFFNKNDAVEEAKQEGIDRLSFTLTEWEAAF